MSIRKIATVSLLATALQLGISRGAAAQSPTEIVIEWNRILQATLGIPGALPPTIFVTRPFAILHVAMFDALNSIDYTYRPYAVRATVVGSPSREVAAAKAARDVMVAMFPAQAATFDAALAVTVNRFPGDPATQGLNVGAVAAQAILAARANDGWFRAAQLPYILPNLPGYLAAGAAAKRDGNIGPLSGGASIRDRKPQPVPDAGPTGVDEPALRRPSQRSEDPWFGDEHGSYSPANADRATLGGGRLFHERSWVWYNLGRDLARTRALNGVDTARVLALLSITMHDALLTSFTGKFLYGLWRPTTAIRGADRDNNPATEVDPGFVSLIATPPYPSYPGNMACIGASSSALFARTWGRDDIPFSVTWTGIAPQADVTRSYNGFRQLADEEARSRIYAGIHFTFDHTASFGVCTDVANYVFANYLVAR